MSPLANIIGDQISLPAESNKMIHFDTKKTEGIFSCTTFSAVSKFYNFSYSFNYFILIY